MGLLKSVGKDQTSVLESEHIVGRSPRASLRLQVPYVSGQHATIRWTSDGWELKDLGSRNGTLCEGKPLPPGLAIGIRRGVRICFGRNEQAWELADDSPPQPMIIPEDNPDQGIVVDSDVIALPTQQKPWATVFRWKDGSFRLEKEEQVCTLVGGQTFELQGQRWRFSCPANTSRTSTVDWPAISESSVDGAALYFSVSPDEEHVELHLRQGARQQSLGSRAHNYLLLFLARHRLADTAHGVDASSSGWVYREELMSALKLDREQLNLAIFRIRKQFETAGVSEAAGIIERRPDTQQLRIGVPRLEVGRG
jgi:hypothetical protein